MKWDVNLYNQYGEECACMRVKLLQSCLTLCDFIVRSPPGPLSMRFSRQEHQSVLPSSHPGDPPDPGIKPVSLMSPALVGGFFSTSTKWEAQRTAWSLLKKLKLDLPYVPEILLLNIYPEKTIIRKDTRKLNVCCSTVYISQDIEAT